MLLPPRRHEVLLIIVSFLKTNALLIFSLLSRDTILNVQFQQAILNPAKSFFPFLDVFTSLRWSDYLRDHFLSLLL